jgi:hypothetical protein
MFLVSQGGVPLGYQCRLCVLAPAVKLTDLGTHGSKLIDAGGIEHAITDFARSSNGGLILTASALSARHRELIIALAARHKLPAVYYRRGFVTRVA